MYRNQSKIKEGIMSKREAVDVFNEHFQFGDTVHVVVGGTYLPAEVMSIAFLRNRKIPSVKVAQHGIVPLKAIKEMRDLV
jgi:hypothetical protein